MNEDEKNQEEMPENANPDAGEDGVEEPIADDHALDATEDEPEAEVDADDADDDPESQIAALKDELLRARAEMQNLRARHDRELEDKLKYAPAGLARDVLSVGDNMRRTLESLPEAARSENELLEALAAGVEATERELLRAFEAHQIKKLEPLGEKFDPKFHQAMFEVPDSGQPAGTVVQVMQAGYVLRDRLLRPAMVGVAKGEPEKIDTEA
ncbi:MAG: nucleotide exchange factor GrpE [Rhodospirillaceae bacterium]|jgi:molecular chaperone GrpE|nr:nucleotide exchange factor GrpE [Rhodospirillaceae bacterium]MBT5373619.1 nucleotide exchange factor GrpE [Rhodospirillaceae bacterium]MBT5659675.1 nucleotide exchange factor GrpE [Rhodospirillaceae bacterium]MBT5751150.1 nucleotide exchange factor GrpE [Rhodospirillaceae bacterium]